MLKLARRARGHFVTLIEIRMHLIRVKPGHISNVLQIFIVHIMLEIILRRTSDVKVL